MGFKVGDHVRLVNGQTRMVVTEFTGVYGSKERKLRAAYISKTGHFHKEYACRWRPVGDFTFWDGHPSAIKLDDKIIEEPKEKIMAKQDRLYKFANRRENDTFDSTRSEDAEIICKKLAVDDAGNWIMQPIEGGAAVTIKSNEVTEIVPFTCQVRRIDGSTTPLHNDIGGPRLEHFQFKKGSVGHADILMHSSGVMYIVTEVDTKKHDQTEFKGRRVVTEEL